MIKSSLKQGAFSKKQKVIKNTFSTVVQLEDLFHLIINNGTGMTNSSLIITFVIELKYTIDFRDILTK